MARLIKGGSIDDGQFPLPPDPRQHGRAVPTHGVPGSPQGEAFAGVEPAELQHALTDLQQIIGLVHGMRPEVQQLSEALRDGGREQGYREGIAQAQHEVHTSLVEVLATLTDAQGERLRIAREHEGALANLALTIARKVIGAHLEADPRLIADIVQSTIAELEPTVAIVVHVHPDDLAPVEDARAELERMVPSGRIEIVSDETVDRGGVILRSPVGEVDARVATKLGVLEAAFQSQRRRLVEG